MNAIDDKKMNTVQSKKPFGAWEFVGWYFVILMVLGTILNFTLGSPAGGSIAGVVGLVVVFLVDRNRRKSYKPEEVRKDGKQKA